MGNYGYLGLVIQGARTFYCVDRKIKFPGVKETAHHNHKSWDLLTGLQGGVKIKAPDAFTKNFYLIPSVRVDYLNIFESGFQESGAGPIDLSVQNQHSTFLRSEITLRRSSDQLLLGTELSTKCFNNLSLRASYEAHIGDHHFVQEGIFKLEWAF